FGKGDRFPCACHDDGGLVGVLCGVPAGIHPVRLARPGRRTRALTCRAMPEAPPARQFPVLSTSVDATTEGFKRNDATHRELVADLRERMLRAAEGGPESARQRHQARGKLLPRERVYHLLDQGSPFLELSPLAAFGMYGDECPAAGIITGIGLVSG